MTTGSHRREHDLVALGETRHGGTDLFDDTGGFVAENDRKLHGSERVDHRDIRMTDPTVRYLDDDFVRPRIAAFDIAHQ